MTNLRKENIVDGVHHGDILTDAVAAFKPYFTFPEFIKINKSKPIALLTIHRAETLNNNIRLSKVLSIAGHLRPNTMLFLIHPNTQKHLVSAEIETRGLIAVNPYLQIRVSLRNNCSKQTQLKSLFHKVNVSRWGQVN